MSESTESSKGKTSAHTGLAVQPKKARPTLLPIGIMALIGLCAVAWLTLAVTENLISRTTKRAEIEVLSKRLGALRNSLRDIESEVETNLANRTVLQQAVDGLTVRKEALSRFVQEAQAVIDKAEAKRLEHEELTREITKMSRSLNEAKKSRKEIVNQIASQQQRADDLKVANEGEADRLQTMRNDLQSLRSEHNRTEAETREAQRGVAGLQARLEEKRQQLSIVSKQLDSGRRELGALEAKIDDARTEVKAANRDAGREKAALETVRHKREALAGEVAQLDSKKSTLKQEIAGLEQDRHDIAQARTNLTKLRAKLDSTQGQLQLLQPRIEALRVKERILSSRIRDLSAQQDRLEKVRQRVSQAEQGLANLKGQRDRLATEANVSQGRLRGLLEDEAELKARIATLEAKRDNISKKAADLGKLRAEWDRLAAATSAAQGRLRGLLEDEAELKARIATLEVKRDNTSKKAADLGKLRAEWDRLAAATSAAQGRLRGLLEDEAELKARIATLEVKRDNTSKKAADLGKLRAEWDRLAAATSAAQGRLRGLLEDEAVHKARISKLEPKRDALAKEISALETQRDSFAAKVNVEQRQLDNLRTKEAKLKEQIVTLEKRHTDLNKKKPPVVPGEAQQ